MATMTYVTPNNNEFKQKIMETRYLSDNEVLSDNIKKLMDIDIVRDLANKAIHLNPDMPYDVASLTAKQIYLGEPITGIELPIIEEETIEEELSTPSDILEDLPFNDKEMIDNEQITEDTLVGLPTNDLSLEKEEIPKIEETEYNSNDLIFSDNELVENLDLELNNILENDLLKTLPDSLIDGKNEETKELLFEELPKEDILLDDSLIKDITPIEDTNELLFEEPLKEENIIVEEPIKEDILIEEPLTEDLVIDENLLEELPTFSEKTIEEPKEDILIEEPLTEDLVIDENLLEELPIIAEKAIEEPVTEKKSDLGNTLTNGLSIGFEDEPVFQKTKRK
ncbi:MAG: hypothetical protein RSB77_02125 [Bacilli bacterium]